MEAIALPEFTAMIYFPAQAFLAARHGSLRSGQAMAFQ